MPDMTSDSMLGKGLLPYTCDNHNNGSYLSLDSHTYSANIHSLNSAIEDGSYGAADLKGAGVICS